MTNVAKTKLDITFDAFTEAAKAKGHTAERIGNSIYLVKPSKGSKVELNINSCWYSLGFGFSGERLSTLISQATDKGFKVVKQPKGWVNLGYESLDRFFELVELVDSLVAVKTPKAPKAEKVSKPSKPAPMKVGESKSTKTPEEIAAIREANLAKMKAVSAKLKEQKEAAAA